MEYPLSIITKDGQTRQLEMTLSPILDQDNGYMGVIASFIDKTKAFELSLQTETLDIFRQIQDVSLYSYPVHISGETGTGKERVANAIHHISSFGRGAFVPVNCGAIPEGIVESELFGHVKGAFSGAVRERKGRFELAHGTRIISATNKNLKEEVMAGNFREDLFYRLNVIPIHLPPLRQRKSDIPLLASHFLREAESQSPHTAPDISPRAMDVLLDYHWPGNVRELKNAIQFAMVRSRGDIITPSHLPMEIIQDEAVQLRTPPLEAITPIGSSRGKLDSESVMLALKKTGGNKSKAARVLGVGRATLYRFLADNTKMQEYADQL
ncbi:MAG: hypothetical protein CSB32_02175 [Desulfobacterales bacterium]|nr:MAG: hypothetical protein CSB32_02175 [Desulfobacterales bacterium]